jgi:DNA-binding NarL/FixJ family response regulator
MNITETSERRVVSPEMSLSTMRTLGYQVMDKLQEHISHTRHAFNFLTYREREVLRLVADGHTDRMVAEALVISPRTVNRHLSNIFTKLHVPGRAAAVALALRQGLF